MWRRPTQWSGSVGTFPLCRLYAAIGGWRPLILVVLIPPVPIRVIEGGDNPFLVGVGEPFSASQQEMSDPVERVAFVASMSGHLLLGALSDLGDHLVRQPDQVEMIHHDLGSGQQLAHRTENPRHGSTDTVATPALTLAG